MTSEPKTLETQFRTLFQTSSMLIYLTVIYLSYDFDFWTFLTFDYCFHITLINAK